MALSNSQIAQIRALAATGLAPDAIAAQVGVEVGDVQSAIGGGLSGGDVGGGEVQVVRRVTKRIPSAWILAHGVTQEGVSFEIVAGAPGSIIFPFAASGVLRYNSAPYQLPASGPTDLNLCLGTDPNTAIGIMILSGFLWGATHDVGMAFTFVSPDQADRVGLPLSFYLGNIDPLTDGDSDVDVTVFYVTASV